MTMHIGIAGPLATADVRHLLHEAQPALPDRMQGSSLLVSLIEELLRRGHRVSAFTVEPSLAPRPDNIVRARGERFDLYYVPLRRRPFRYAGGVRGRMLDGFALERQALVTAMRRAGADIVHAHWQYEYAWAALDAGAPCLVTCHDDPHAILRLSPGPYRLGRLLMARHVLRRARHLTAISPSIAARLRHMASVPIEVVPNPVPAAVDAGYSGTGHRAAGRAPRVVSILNGWSRWKNPQRGLRALYRLRQRHHDVELHLVGPDFGNGEKAAHWAARHGMGEAFNFHGRLPYRQTQELLARMDLLLHPSLQESFGMTIAEAMSLGIPVVAGRHSGAVPWVSGDGAAGRLVEVTSVDAMAAAMAELLDDPQAYARCSAAGRRLAAERFAVAAVADAYLERYRRILGAPCADAPAESPAWSTR